MQGSTKTFDPGMEILDYFGITDGLDVVWSHGVNSQDKLEQALADSMMIEGDIMFRWNGLPNQV